MKVVRLKSDNFDCFMSELVYNEIRLQMSSGDFGTHRVKHLEIPSYKIHSLKQKDKWFEPEEIELGKSILQDLNEAEETSITDNIDQYEWLIEHRLEDKDEVLRQFVENYRPDGVIIPFAGSNYECDFAKEVLERLGPDKTFELLMSHGSIEAGELYYNHWNQLAYESFEEYETQVDIEPEDENYQDLLRYHQLTGEGELYNDTLSFWLYVHLGGVRFKVDPESFEVAVSELIPELFEDTEGGSNE